jgi:8-oxo-dGTP diphosphatase
MRALGYSAWLHQTVGNVEKGKRRVTAEEIFGLSVALETTIAALMAPLDVDAIVDFPSGATVSVAHVQLSAHGVVNPAIRWDGDVPVFPAASAYPPPWTGEAATPAVQAIQQARRRLTWESLTAEQQEQHLADAAELASGGLPVSAELPPEERPPILELKPLNPEAELVTQSFVPSPDEERDRRATAARDRVVAAIVTSDRGVLVTRRVDQNPPWGFTAGWGEPGESPEDTIIREVKEEAGLRIEAGEYLGERDHPATGKHMIYYAARPTHGTEIHLGDKGELLEVRWVSLAEADELMGSVPGGIYGPVREHLARELGEG